MHNWDPNDDPHTEDARNANCAFIRLAKQEDNFTVLDFLVLEKERAQNRARKVLELFEQETGQAMREVHYELDKLRRKLR
ncbi:hypothetical protein MRX96_007493 [Rhipicephalus microplus]